MSEGLALVENSTKSRLLTSSPDSVIYRLAADMTVLAEKMMETADKHNDGALRDYGFAILHQAREMVQEHLHYVAYVAECGGSK
ncbi:MAG: hypothetical protein WCQ50_16995 [Spirochaetota bacterium]